MIDKLHAVFGHRGRILKLVVSVFGAFLVAVACGESLEVTPTAGAPDGGDTTTNPEGNIGGERDGGSAEASSLEEPDEVELDAALADAGCGEKETTFLNELNVWPVADFQSVITDGGAIEKGGTETIVASVNVNESVSAYLRRSLCDKPVTVKCTMNVKVRELIGGQLALLDLVGVLPTKESVHIRVRTDEAQLSITGKPVERRPNVMNLANFMDVSITVKPGSVDIMPGNVSFPHDGGLNGIKFTELRSGILYIARKNPITPSTKGVIEVESIGCTFIAL